MPKKTLLRSALGLAALVVADVGVISDLKASIHEHNAAMARIETNGAKNLIQVLQLPSSKKDYELLGKLIIREIKYRRIEKEEATKAEPWRTIYYYTPNPYLAELAHDVVDGSFFNP